MSRLLFAAARGARVQTWAGVLGWRSTNLFGPWSYDDGDRIHPDDAHLAYGPISTALREIALTGDYEDRTIPYLTSGIEREDNYWESTADLYRRCRLTLTTLSRVRYDNTTRSQRRVFLLILAEALADEGL